jgi:surface antigen
MTARANPRGRPLAALALALSLGAAAISPAPADAGAQPFPVRLSVTAIATARVDEVTVVARSVSHATCSLRAGAGKTARSFPGASTGRAGAVTWRWPLAGIATDVPWRFTATCRLGASWSQRWVNAELGFPSRGGALAGSTFSAANQPGASCDSQGVCFAQDPFPVGQCTWYAAGRRPDLLGIVHGDAAEWLGAARGRLPEGPFPVVGALAVWLPHEGGAGAQGHVGYVAASSETGRVLIDDSNWTPTPTSPHLQVHEHWVAWTSPSGYIYGGPAGGGPSA